MILELKRIMEGNGIDALFISNIFNVRYISGYNSDDAYVLVIKDKLFFITDTRYTEDATYSCSGFEIINWHKCKSVGRAVSDLLDKEGVKELHFEEKSTSYSLYKDIMKNTSLILHPVKDIVEGLRSVKNQDEIDHLKKACAIGDRAFSRILNEIRVGMSEKEISSKLAYYLRMEGSDARNYENIALSGERTSLLHGIPSDRKVQEGDLILMDFGAGYKGYLSDMSRTIVMGKASEKQKEIYTIIKASVENMVASIKSGIKIKEAYKASVKPMSKTQYMQYHYAGVGHGIGLAVHEIPFIGPDNDAVFLTNNVITLEPGVYIPNWGGVRIEEQVIVTDEGCDVITKSPTDLIEIA
jgi:Xaa-Pro aminopeptidase